MDFTKASLSCQQYRGKTGIGGEPIQRAQHAVSQCQTFLTEREEALCLGSRLLSGWHIHDPKG